jgi:hypothetical protein
VSTPASPLTGVVDFGDATFTPDERPQYGDAIRWFRMDTGWPQKPPQGRKFQLGGKERGALLAPGAYVSYQHRFNQKYMGSGVNGTRKCCLEKLDHCLACDHYSEAPTVLKDGRNVKQAKCGPRTQTFAANILIYKTDLDGNFRGPATPDNPLGPRLAIVKDRGIFLADAAGNPTDTPGELVYEVFLWRFNADKFGSIRQIKADWGDIRTQDLVFVLAANKEPQFQDFSIQASPHLAWKLSPQPAEVVKYFQENSYDAEKILGKDWSDDDMRGFIHGQGENGPRNPAGAADEIAADIAAAIGQPLAQQPQPASVDSLMSMMGQGTTPPVPQAPPTPEPPKPPAGSFDDLLNGAGS